jgi:serine/threonine protein kinase
LKSHFKSIKDDGIPEDATITEKAEIRERNIMIHKLKLQEDGDPNYKKQVVGQFMQICSAIDHCHNSDILHKNLKPENICL